MSTREKLIRRFKSQPRDFTFDEMIRLFALFGFEIDQKGGTSGSRLALTNWKKELSYNMHRPHPEGVIKMYVMRQVYDYLIEHEFIEEE